MHVSCILIERCRDNKWNISATHGVVNGNVSMILSNTTARAVTHRALSKYYQNLNDI